VVNLGFVLENIMGICAVKYRNKRENCLDDLLILTSSLWTPEEVFYGFAVWNDEGYFYRRTDIEHDLREVEGLGEIFGYMGIARVSGTKTGQPYIPEGEPEAGPFALTFDGFFEDKDALRDEQGRHVYRPFNAEIAGGFLKERGDFKDGLVSLREEILRGTSGYYTIGIITGKGYMYVSRSYDSPHDVFIGADEKRVAVSTDIQGLEKLGLKIVSDVKGGEIVVINPDNTKTSYFSLRPKRRID